MRSRASGGSARSTSQGTASSGASRTSRLVLAVLVALALVLLVLQYGLRIDLDAIGGNGEGGLDVLLGTLLSWKVYALVAGIFALERRMPAETVQGDRSAAVGQDALFFVLEIGLWYALLGVYLRGLGYLFTHELSFLRTGIGASWPFALLVVVSYLLGDFLAWLHHVIRHKVPVLWRFHAVHHSQRQMSLFTDSRVHPMEFFFARTLVFVPFFALGGVYSYDLHILSALLGWYARFYHSSVRTNLGVLRYVFVTPQSHRVHHSIEERHHDQNFGVTLSVWDRLFHTHHPDDHSYPPTGIADTSFPLEQRWGGRGLLGRYGSQLLYPFRRAKRVDVEVPSVAQLEVA